MRFLLGLGVGGASQIVPMYIAELAPAERRGSQGVLFQVMICVGTLVAYAVGYALGPSAAWEWMLGLAAIPAVIFMGVMLYLPESPRWLVVRGRLDDAKSVLRSVRHGEQEISQEIHEIQQLHIQSKQSHWRELFQPWVRPALVAALGVAFFSQATGISAIIYYAPSLLELSGFGTSAAILGSVGIGLALTSFTILGIYLLDYWGRRKLILIGLPGAVVVLAIMAVLLPWSTQAHVEIGEFAKMIVLICLLGYFAFNGGSLSVVAWLYFAEVFPLSVRGKGTAISAFCLWVVNFLMTLFLYFAAKSLGVGLVFGVLAAINAVAFVFALFYVPETKGRSLEDIEASLVNGTFRPMKLK
jgi:sugar porter (SP) family MFS transporter